VDKVKSGKLDIVLNPFARTTTGFWFNTGFANCAKSGPESDLFMPSGLALSEKQIPRFIGNVSS
jgi:hypothetical protein